jgi:meso-butanediol dehydrogenase/(S,S)-butanediol dehydrogenase/diacetyl reductase
MSGRLEGRRALVTGAASGIGAGVVERFREEGASVVGTDLAGADLVLDVRDRRQTEAVVAEAVERLGGLDVVVCNAGRPAVGPLHELDEDVWDDALATNLKSVYLMARAAWPHLVASRGSILVTGSIVGLWGSQNQAAYCASKAGAGMLVRCLALDGAKDGVRANCVCPGFTETPLLERFLAEQDDPEGVRAAVSARHPLGRLGRPRDVADAFVYLASDEAEWVTGVSLPVDGGFTSGIWG